MHRGIRSSEPHFLFLSRPSPGLVQRCVIIQKDQHGFGFTVSGDRIVLVQSVRPGEGAEGTTGDPQPGLGGSPREGRRFWGEATRGQRQVKARAPPALPVQPVGGWLGNSLRQALGKHSPSGPAALGAVLQETLPLLLYNDFAGWQGWEQQFRQTMSCLFYSGCSHLLPPSPPPLLSSPKARKNENIGKGKRCEFRGQGSAAAPLSCTRSCVERPPLVPGGWGGGRGPSVPGEGSVGASVRTGGDSQTPRAPPAANKLSAEAGGIPAIPRTFHSPSSLPCLGPLAQSRELMETFPLGFGWGEKSIFRVF